VQLIDASGFWQKMRKSLGSKRKELSENHIAEITSLFGNFEESKLAELFDANGQAAGRFILPEGCETLEPPEGGKVRISYLSKILPTDSFGYRTITVERPQRDESGQVVLGAKGKQKGLPQPDSSLRDTENVPLAEDVEKYYKREVLPHVPDAWIDHDKTKVGYEIPFNRHFYVFEPPRHLEEIDADLARVSANIMEMLKGLGV